MTSKEYNYIRCFDNKTIWTYANNRCSWRWLMLIDDLIHVWDEASLMQTRFNDMCPEAIPELINLRRELITARRPILEKAIPDLLEFLT